MRRITTIFIFLTGGFSVNGQPLFKTIISPQPVVAGESFQVQYVLEDVNKTSFVKPPAFTGFRLITGPNVYTGTIPYLNGVKAVQNFVYTVEATRAGKFLIPGATTIVNGKFLKSNDVVIEVMPSGQMTGLSAKKTGDINSDYFLRPGEDPYAKIRRNLFLRVLVDKKNCFVGEPVVATYKLYSRLESKSDIVKNPGFYGFAVYDMINLADKEVVTENVNGKLFDVHTIRKVQLYPLQPGVFMIDAMEVKNRVEFSRTAVNKKTEQEIVEGVLGNNDEEHTEGNTETVETEMSKRKNHKLLTGR